MRLETLFLKQTTCIPSGKKKKKNDLYSTSGYSNGYHNHELGLVTGNEPEGGHVAVALADPGDSFRFSTEQQPQLEAEQKVTPCTDFDMASFHSYAHVGIHEDKIKVSIEIFFYLHRCYCFFVSLDFGIGILVTLLSSFSPVYECVIVTLLTNYIFPRLFPFQNLYWT